MPDKNDDENPPVYWSESTPAICLAVITAGIGMCISLYGIKKHAEYYNAPRTQKYIFRIIFVVPVFAVCSAISVLWTETAIVALTLRDVYEAFIVYSFLTLILEYAGGEHSCIEQIKHEPPIRRPVPLCLLVAVRRDASLLRACKQGTLQFVVIKPIMAVISLCVFFIMGHDDYYHMGFQIPLLCILNTSYAVALYYLVLFFFATRSILQQFNVVLKFVAVKIFVFATFWFSVLLQARFAHEDAGGEIAMQMNNVILCYEMVFFALLLNHAFPYHEFFTPHQGKPVVESVRQMMNVGDVLQDAYHSFTPSYQDYVVAREDGDRHANASGSSNAPSHSKQDDDNSPQKVIRTRTYLIGNLDRISMEKDAESESSRHPPDSPNMQHESPNGATAAAKSMEYSLESGQGIHSEDTADDLPEHLQDHHSYGFDGEWLNDVVEVDLKNDKNSRQYADL